MVFTRCMLESGAPVKVGVVNGMTQSSEFHAYYCGAPMRHMVIEPPQVCFGRVLFLRLRIMPGAPRRLWDRLTFCRSVFLCRRRYAECRILSTAMNRKDWVWRVSGRSTNEYNVIGTGLKKRNVCPTVWIHRIGEIANFTRHVATDDKGVVSFSCVDCTVHQTIWR